MQAGAGEGHGEQGHPDNQHSAVVAEEMAIPHSGMVAKDCVVDGVEGSEGQETGGAGPEQDFERLAPIT